MSTSVMTPPTAVVETLERLSSKSGVVAALAMDRLSSTVLASTGNLQAFNVSAAVSTSASNTSTTTASGTSTNLRASVHENSATSASATSVTSTTKATDGTFEFASRIWHYVNLSGQLVQDMDAEDDLKLLRLRTRKHEFMIVPDTKYIFVVVHEVPS